MKHLLIILTFLTIALDSFSQGSKVDTVCIPRKDAIYKIAQADSLPIVKQDLELERITTEILRQRVSLRDSVIHDFSIIENEYKAKISGHELIEKAQDKEIKSRNDQIGVLNKQLRRQKTKTIVAGALSIAAVVLPFVIKH